jgi:hypothetical protein
MKKSILLLSLLASAVVLSSGCTKSQSHKDDLNKKIADILEKSKQDNEAIDKMTQDILKSMTYGGQPGSLTLNGVIVLEGEKLDSRVSLSQEAGLSRSGSATAIAKTLTSLKFNAIEADTLEKLKVDFKKRETEEKTYINLGCELAESEIAGLNEVSATEELEKDLVHLSATRIFICGEQKINKLSIIVSANELMLKDASIKNEKSIGNLTLSTGTLILLGKNKIATIGENGPSLILPAASITLTVANEIYGDGELTVESKGGNNIDSKK